MSPVGNEFLTTIGKPNLKMNLGFKFSMEWDQIVLEDLHNEIGAGIFYNGFLHLIGADVVELNSLLEHWKFLFNDDNTDRKVIGRNAHGSLLIIEKEKELGTTAPVGYLDLINGKYIKDINLDFLGLFGSWIPNNKLGNLLDLTIYNHFVNGNSFLRANEIIAIKVPTCLKGELTKSNFQIENIFEYHSSISKVYKRASRK
jgi:hypothetical protein